MRLWIRVMTCVYLCMLASCSISLSQQRQTQNIKPVPQMEHSIEKRLQKKEIFSKGTWPNRQWWLTYGSPELNQLISEALANNPSIQKVKKE